MAIPYDTTSAGTSVRDALGHSYIKHNGTWTHLEKIHIKHNSAWQETKEVYVKSGGSWRKVHEGEHFLFSVYLNANQNGEFNLTNHLNGNGWNGTDPIKGFVRVGNNALRRQVNLGNFSADSLIYLRVDPGSRIQARGGNGGAAGGGAGANGANGQRALYSKTNFILDNAGIIAGGGGGGSGGNNSNYTYPVQQSNSCQKGETCYSQNFVTVFVPGGGGGGGAGYPNSSGGAGGSSDYNGGNGTANQFGSGGGAAQNGTSNGGGNGGNLGKNGQNSAGPGNAGTAGAAIEGINYRVQANTWGSGDGDIRDNTINS